MGFHYSRGVRHGAVLAFAAFSFSSIARAQAVIRGVLYDDASGAPVSGAIMLIDPRTDAAVVHTATDSAGRFSLQAGAGVYQIGAVRPGYVSVLSAPMGLQSGEKLTVRVPIAQKGDPEHRIGVTEHVRPGSSGSLQSENRGTTSGFDGRRALGMGLHYDREQLSRHGDGTLGEFLRAVPGLQVPDPSGMSSVQMSRNGGVMPLNFRNASASSCHVGWFIDGRRMDLPGQSDPLTDGLGSTHLDAIEAIEVFRGVSEMPAEFAAPDLRCGAIAVWMRRG
jgi:hypothetical protein